MKDPVIRVRGLRKSYGDREVVGGIDLDVEPGEIVAFVGPNGAGKTTTVEILEGYRSRDAGEVQVLGEDPARAGRGWRSRVGLVLQTCTMPGELTVREVLELYAGYYPHPRPVAETIELVGLADRPSARTGGLSGGQRRRLDVALALIGDPELVFLDEPTTGFDPSARHHAWEVIGSLRDLGKTIFLTTHYMDEAQALADRVAVIAAGSIVAEGTPDALGGRDTAASEISFGLPPGVPLSTAAGRGPRGRPAPRRTGPPAVHRAGPGAERAHRVGRPARARPGRPDRRPALARGRLPAAHRGRGAPRVTGRRLFVHQFRSDLRRFWRTPQSRYFTVLLPIVFLVIFAAIFKGTTIIDGKALKLTTFYVPGIMTLGIISATFVNLTIAVVTQRESGELKRVRGTPLPARFVIASRAAVGVVVALVMSALLLAIGRLLYDVPIPHSTMVGLVVAVVVGAATFSCLGFAISTRIGAADAAAPVTNLIVLPLYFISGVFIPESQIPPLLHDIANVFPIRHLSQALLKTFTHTHGAGLSPVDLLILVAWGAAGLVFAARNFRWSPRSA